MSLIDAHLEEVSAEYHCVEEGSMIDCTMMHHYTLGLLTQSSMSCHVMVQLTEIYLLIQSRLVWSIAATVCLSVMYSSSSYATNSSHYRNELLDYTDN